VARDFISAAEEVSQRYDRNGKVFEVRIDRLQLAGSPRLAG
jgi:hypothetical protein